MHYFYPVRLSANPKMLGMQDDVIVILVKVFCYEVRSHFSILSKIYVFNSTTSQNYQTQGCFSNGVADYTEFEDDRYRYVL